MLSSQQLVRVLIEKNSNLEVLFQSRLYPNHP
jgi:hypothetical protein